MKKTRIKTGKDVTKLLEGQGCEIRMGKGSHRVAKLPNGETMTYYEHGEFPIGTKLSILKALKRAGFLVASILLILLYLGSN